MTEKCSFVCQRCLSPLRLDSSFLEKPINEHTLAELSLSTLHRKSSGKSKTSISESHNDEEAHESESSILIPPFKLGDPSHNASYGFTLVDDEGNGTGGLSQRLQMTVELFDMISSGSEIDHPLCEECTDSLLETMDQQLKLAEEEAQSYQAFLKELDKETEDTSSVAALEKELAELESLEKALMAEVEDLKGVEETEKKHLQQLVDEKAELDKKEELYWRDYSYYKLQLLEAEDEYRFLDSQYQSAQRQLSILKKTNVFNATFHIWHTGHFATINGFRLGRLPSIPVEWQEINAAWGQTALLLSVLAKKIGMVGFHKYELVPYGSYSFIKVLSDNKILPLYGSGGFRMIWDTKFDSAMVAFLDCLSQFGLEIERQESGFSLPYEMDKEKGRIRDQNSCGQFYSIKVQFNSEDYWTKALRYMLTNLKWGLAFVSTHQIQRS